MSTNTDEQTRYQNDLYIAEQLDRIANYYRERRKTTDMAIRLKPTVLSILREIVNGWAL